jgi:hypothetical protein
MPPSEASVPCGGPWHCLLEQARQRLQVPVTRGLTTRLRPPCCLGSPCRQTTDKGAISLDVAPKPFPRAWFRVHPCSAWQCTSPFGGEPEGLSLSRPSLPHQGAPRIQGHYSRVLCFLGCALSCGGPLPVILGGILESLTWYRMIRVQGGPCWCCHRVHDYSSQTVTDASGVSASIEL